MADRTYRLGAIEIAPWRQVSRNGCALPVGGKALDLLSVLAEAEGNLVTKDELMAAVWPGVIVEENAIQVHMSAARKALGADADRLVTVRGRGYRLQTDTVHATRRHMPLPTIAVLPFASLGDDPRLNAFAQGLREDIGSALARIKSLSVSASAFEAVRDGACSPSDVGERFGVRYLLHGSVDADDSDVRIRLRLTDTSDGTKIWSEKYAHALPANFALQDEVTLQVAAAMEPTIEIVEARRAARSRTDLLGSYDLFVKGFAKVYSYEQAEMFEGIALMEAAIELAPDFGLAMAAAGISLHDAFIFGWGDDLERNRQRSLELLERSLRISPDDASVLAWVACGMPVLTGNLGRASALIERALRANPSSAHGWFASGYIRACRGDAAGSGEDMATARRLANDGWLSSHAHMSVGISRGMQGAPAEAVEIMEEAGHCGPLNDLSLATWYAEAGRSREALAALDRYQAVAARSPAEFLALFPEKGQAMWPLGALNRLLAERRAAGSASSPQAPLPVAAAD